jgi:hypothetical protein
MFKSLNGSANDYEIPKITYNEFLKELKASCAVIGLNSTLFATHSLRRGSVSDQFTNGVPNKVIKYSCRWRSNVFKSYIDHTVLFELQLETIHPQKYFFKKKIKKKKLGIGKLASIITPRHYNTHFNRSQASQIRR